MNITSDTRTEYDRGFAAGITIWLTEGPERAAAQAMTVEAMRNTGSDVDERAAGFVAGVRSVVQF